MAELVHYKGPKLYFFASFFQAKGVNLACVRACVVVAEERPRITLTTSFTKLFASLGLKPGAVSTSFGCRVNLAMCLQVRTLVHSYCVQLLRCVQSEFAP